MKNCRMIWLAAILLMAGVEAVAQNRGEGERHSRPSAEQMAEHQTSRMTEALGLNPEQAARVGELNRQQAEQRRAHREAMQQEHAAHREALREVLTAEQFSRWEQMQQERQQRFRPEMRGDSSCHRGKGHRGCGCCHKPHRRGQRGGAPRVK